MKTIWLTILLLLCCSASFSQFADQGSGNYNRQIWWLDWAGFTVQEGASRTFNTNNGLAIKVAFSHVSTAVPVPWIMNTWPGSLLWFLYNFSDPNIKPALYQEMSPTNFNYTLTITATRNGAAVPFALVTADAEASDIGETTTLQTNGSNWQSIEFFRNSTQTNDPLTGCGTNTVSIANTYAGNTMFNPTPYGQNVVLMTQSPGTNPLVLATNSDHAGTTGGMALAFGIFYPTDRGDLPVSGYGTAQHELLYTPANSCNFNAPFPTLNQTTNLHIGAVPGDPDPIQYDNDDSIGVDEEGVGTFAVYNNAGTYSVNLTVTNTTGSGAYLTGWFDYNRDGTFGASESVTATIPNNATSATLTWTGLPQYLPQGTATGYGFRFRISSDQASARSATGYAPDGEVEDYFVPPATLCAPVSLILSPDQSICSGRQTTLTASGASDFAWSPPTGLSDPAGSNPIATPSATTTYTVTASTPQGCTAQGSVTVTVNASPTISITGPAILCIGHADTLTAFGGSAYIWSENNQVIASGPTLITTPGASSRIYATGSAPDGCSSTDSIDVTVKPLPVFDAIASSPLVCVDDTVRLTASGGDQYAWQSFSGQPLGGDSTILVAPGANTVYIVQISDSVCRQSRTLQVPVSVKDLPDIRATSSNDITCTVTQATLHATGGVTYAWSPAPGISTLNSANPVVSPIQSTTYYVKGTGGNGCSNIDSVNVKVDFNSELNHFPMASAFTPNNDGRNDCFGLKNWPQIGKVEFSVYNRWGVPVFYTTDVNQCWDGTYNGVPQPAGTYVYQIKAAGACGTAFRKGTVILIR
ncbi:MAG TPA: CshA/CshB family fibrillar adhesin-related protein [Puia sp.]|nr:CshA/CshB family fibrillar adhesin-related protein [Puia sp.]